MPLRPHNFRGFTMMELVLVLLVLTIIAGMVIPSLSGVARGRLAPNVAYNILSLAKYAHTQALSEGRNYCLEINVRDNSYQLFAEEGSAKQTIPGTLGQKYTLEDGMTIGSSIATDNNTQTIRFYPNGRMDVVQIKITRDQQSVLLACPSAAEGLQLSDTEGTK